MIKEKQWLSILMLFLTLTVTAQISKSELEAYSHIKKELPQLKKIVSSKKGEMMGQKVLLEMFFFNAGVRLSNFDSSIFPINVQELIPLNLDGVKQIDLMIESPLMLIEREIVTYQWKYNFNSQGNLESLFYTADKVEVEQGESESAIHFKYKENLLVEIDKSNEKQPIYIGKDHVLLDLTTVADDGEEISHVMFWEFDDEGNILKRRISGDMRMSLTDKYENRYASIYDEKTQTLNGYNVYTSYSEVGDSSSKKFTNNKQIPFEVIDGYEYPDTANVCFSVEQKENIISIFQWQNGTKIKEYVFSLNDKKNIQELFVFNYVLQEDGTFVKEKSMSYKYEYTYW